MAINLTGVFGDISNLLPSSSDLVQQLLVGAAGTVVLSGLKTPEGQSAIDPLHIFIHPATPATPQVTGAVQGANVMTMSQFRSLTPDQQNMISAMKYTIIPG